MSLDRVKSTIKKLLDLAESSEFDGEVDNAIKFARQMMIKHGIEESELHTEAELEEELTDFDVKTNYTLFKKVKNWEVSLAFAVCDIVGYVKFYTDRPEVKKNQAGLIDFSGGKPKEVGTIKFYGPKKYTDLAAEIYDNLTLVINSVSQLRYGASPYMGRGRNYAEGFATGVRSQVKIAERNLIKNLSESTALVALDKNNALIKKVRNDAVGWLREKKGIRLVQRDVSTSNRFDADAYNQGKKDGSRVNIKTHERKKLT